MHSKLGQAISYLSYYFHYLFLCTLIEPLQDFLNVRLIFWTFHSCQQEYCKELEGDVSKGGFELRFISVLGYLDRLLLVIVLCYSVDVHRIVERNGVEVLTIVPNVS